MAQSLEPIIKPVKYLES